MDTESSVPETKVPVKVPEPTDHAPPTLAEPASGPVAEMSGALKAQQTTEQSAPTSTTVASAPNGDVQPPAPESAPKPSQEPSTAPKSAPPAKEVAASQDTEIKDDAAGTAEPVSEEAAPEADGGDGGKKGGNGKRKSSGVPEHKNKKLNKKKSMPKITHLDAKPGDHFFARLKSYPSWPSIICDEEMLPTSLLTTRPVTTKKADGTYNEAYADGGKKANERTFPVMFMHTNEFAWIPNTDLADLDPEECKNVSEKGKGKALVAAYQVAGENNDLQYFKTMLLEHAKAMEEDEVQKQEKAAERAAKADKKKRKSEGKVEPEDADMEDIDDSAEVKKPSKKRKKAAESDDDEPEKAAKTPKTTKLKLTTNKTPATTEKKLKDKAAKPKGEKRKSKAAAAAAAEDEEMADAPDAEPEQPLDPEEARKAREREVLFLRHKLQKGFLSRDQAPQEDDMPQMSNYIKKLEAYEELEVGIIRATKINKVLKALVKLNTIPRDEEFHFRQRSVELLGKWNKILGAEPAEDSKETPTTNGVHEEDKPEEAAEDSAKPSEPGAGADGDDGVSSKAEEPKQPSVEDVNPVAAESTKTEGAQSEAAAPDMVDKAPESTEGAVEATAVVKATE